MSPKACIPNEQGETTITLQWVAETIPNKSLKTIRKRDIDYEISHTCKSHKTTLEFIDYHELKSINSNKALLAYELAQLKSIRSQEGELPALIHECLY